jgi:hypothetical protein
VYILRQQNFIVVMVERESVLMGLRKRSNWVGTKKGAAPQSWTTGESWLMLGAIQYCSKRVSVTVMV